jgi:hypothetical protein
MGASAAAAILIRREKDLVAHFRNHGAVDAAHAMTAVALGVEERLAWVVLRNRAIIRDGGPGTYYLDELSWEAAGRRRKRVLVVVIAAVAVALIATQFAVVKEFFGVQH